MVRQTEKIIKVCLWCRNEFKAPPKQKFCSRDHADAFNKMKNHIGHLDFDFNFMAECAKLEELGFNYKLPERIVED